MCNHIPIPLVVVRRGSLVGVRSWPGGRGRVSVIWVSWRGVSGRRVAIIGIPRWGQSLFPLIWIAGVGVPRWWPPGSIVVIISSIRVPAVWVGSRRRVGVVGVPLRPSSAWWCPASRGASTTPGGGTTSPSETSTSSIPVETTLLYKNGVQDHCKNSFFNYVPCVLCETLCQVFTAYMITNNYLITNLLDLILKDF